MERTMKQRLPKGSPYWYVGKVVDSESPRFGQYEPRTTDDHYFFSDDRRWAIGNYFGNPQDAMASIEEVADTIRDAKEKGIYEKVELLTREYQASKPL